MIPPLAVLAGVSIGSLLGQDGTARLKQLVVVAVAILAGMTYADMRQLHPYEAVYFNRLVAGGAANAALRFETDYWGLSIREGVDWLLTKYAVDSSEPLRVANCAMPFQTEYFLEKVAGASSKFRTVRFEDDPQILLATTRFNCETRLPGKTLHVVSRAGVPLLYVIAVQDGPALPSADPLVADLR